MRGAALVGMGGLLVGEGGADGEAGGDSACSSAELQLVGVLRRGKCSGAAAATGREGTHTHRTDPEDPTYPRKGAYTGTSPSSTTIITIIYSLHAWAELTAPVTG